MKSTKGSNGGPAKRGKNNNLRPKTLIETHIFDKVYPH
jgi:hypothetical protein